MNSKNRLLPENELDFIKKIHEMLIDYLDHKQNSLVNPSRPYNDFKSQVNFSLDEPNDHDNIESLIDQYLKSAVDTSSPHFYNQLFSGFSTMGYLGEIISVSSTPWHYIPVWIFVTTPFFYSFCSTNQL